MRLQARYEDLVGNLLQALGNLKPSGYRVAPAFPGYVKDFHRALETALQMSTARGHAGVKAPQFDTLVY